MDNHLIYLQIYCNCVPHAVSIAMYNDELSSIVSARLGSISPPRRPRSTHEGKAKISLIFNEKLGSFDFFPCFYKTK